MAKHDDFDDYAIKDLVELRNRIDMLIVHKHAEEQQALKKKLTELAAEAGFSIEEVLGLNTPSPRGKKAPVTPKYRNPDDPTDTWSGRGRKPNWLVERLKKRGANLDDFAI